MQKLFFTLMLVFPTVLYAQNEPKEFIERFFESYKSKGASAALDELYSTNPWMERSQDALANVKTKLEGLNEDFVGTYYGYDFITKKRLTDSYVLYSYLVRYDRQPIRFMFHFYKPNDTWLFYSFKFDGNIDGEIEEAARIYHVVPTGY